jgi:flagellar biogenesis protein FliO
LQIVEPSEDQPPAPLLSYRRDDAPGSNPLRAQPDPTSAAPTTAAAPKFDAAVQPAVATAPAEKIEVEAPAPAIGPVETPAESPVETPTEAPKEAPLAANADPLPPTIESYGPDDRRLAPRSAERPRGSTRSDVNKLSFLPPAFAKLKSFSSAGAGLAIVVGLFLACTWLLRRGGPKPTGALPTEAFAVLGRAPLTAQSFAQLLRIGNKLVLVAVTADGAHPLAEVNDPAEVDRIAGLCLGAKPGGSSAEFQQVLAELSREPARGFLGREGSAARRRA